MTNSDFLNFFNKTIIGTDYVPTCSYPFTNFWEVNAKIYSSKENDNNYQWLIPFPGLTKEDIKVKVTNDSVIVTNKNGNAFVPKDGSRTIQLPENVIVRKITVTLKDGLLEITLPKKEPDKFDVEIN